MILPTNVKSNSLKIKPLNYGARQGCISQSTLIQIRLFSSIFGDNWWCPYQNPPPDPPFCSSPPCQGSRSKAAAARHLRGSPVFTLDYCVYCVYSWLSFQLKLAALSAAWLPFQIASLFQPLPHHYCQQLYPSLFSAQYLDELILSQTTVVVLVETLKNFSSSLDCLFLSVTL